MKKYKFILYLVFLFILNTIYSQKINKKEVDAIFNQAHKIEIYAFLDKTHWDKEDNKYTYNVYYIKNDSVKINEKYLKNKVTLSENQIKKLKRTISKCELDSEVGECYMPRHVVVFYNDKNEIFGFVELCFDCNYATSSKNLNFIKECFLNQKELFKEFGITYFEEDRNEQKKKLDRLNEINSFFKQIKKVEIYAFLDKTHWDKEDQKNKYAVYYIKNDSVQIKEKYLKNKVTLDNISLIKLKRNVSKCELDPEIGLCYMPRHSVVFYNHKNEIFGYVELCFECSYSISSKNLDFIKDCFLNQENLFKEFGITYFEEDEKDKELIKLKQKELEERIKKLDSKIIKKNE